MKWTHDFFGLCFLKFADPNRHFLSNFSNFLTIIRSDALVDRIVTGQDLEDLSMMMEINPQEIGPGIYIFFRELKIALLHNFFQQFFP